MSKISRRTFLVSCATALAAIPLKSFAFPTVYPHGTTIYKPDKCWNGYNVFGTEVAGEGSVLIDMNGNVLKKWKNICDEEHPTKLLQGGYVMGTVRPGPEKKGRLWKDERSTHLVIQDWDGKIVRKVAHAGMHHDYQVEGNPVGYHAPGMPVAEKNGKILILSNKITENKAITDKPLLDDLILEVDKDNNVLWQWLASDHFEEMNFPESVKETLRKYPTYRITRTADVKGADWLHCNSLSYLDPNHWYEKDPDKYSVFHPDNLIISNRQTNTSNIIDKKTGKIVWQIGPLYYRDIEWKFNGKVVPHAYRRLGQIIGQHHTHMIPKGLPGEGNILIYDNGGYAGYGPRNPGAHLGWSDARRDYSRVIEIDPTNLRVVWEHSADAMGMRDSYRFYSDYVSGMQRLPNGNTLICNGAVGQLQEVTKDNEMVWEYISPFYNKEEMYNLVYRVYRYPYDYVPQLKKPAEKPVIPPDNSNWRVKPQKS